MIRVATRRATGKTDGSFANFNKNVVGNEANFKRFLDIIKDMSEQRAKNKRSIINRGKKTEDQAASAPDGTTAGDETQNVGD